MTSYSSLCNFKTINKTANERRFQKICRANNSKCYRQRSDICHLKNLNQDQSYRSVIGRIASCVCGRALTQNKKTSYTHFYDHFLARFLLHTFSRLGALFGVSILEGKGRTRNELWDVVYHMSSVICKFSSLSLEYIQRDNRPTFHPP